VREQQRDRVGTAAFGDDEMDRVSVDRAPELAQPVQPMLQIVGIERSPIIEEIVEPTPRNASLPPGSEIGRQLRPSQPECQIVQRLTIQYEAVLARALSPGSTTLVLGYDPTMIAREWIAALRKMCGQDAR
jgi:hypothetical protein